MKIILLKDIKNVGRKYQVKTVSDGFARNGLMAKGFALPVTPENLGKLKAEMESAEKASEIRTDLLSKGLTELSEKVVTMSAKANSEGHLFASIHPKEIIEELEKITDLKIDPDWIETKPLKSVGEHEVTLKLDGKTGSFKVIVNSL